MLNVQTRKNTLETTLYEGVTLVSMLLRLGHNSEAASLASQLLVHFPQALPLHVGVGRALLALGDQGGDKLRAIRHLRRVLEADPENWRIRLETVLLYLRSNMHSQADHELWLTAQLVPENRWLGDLLQCLPDGPAFQRTRHWKETWLHQNRHKPNKPSTAHTGEDEAGLARLYLRRQMPWMAVQYFDAAIKRLSTESYTPRLDLKTGLLMALWLNGEVKRASALATDTLLDQPQLILPRLLLTNQLAKGSLSEEPRRLTQLVKPVWTQDSFLERSTELVQEAGFVLPPSLWPQVHPTQVQGAGYQLPQPWHKYFPERAVNLQLGGLDRHWLQSLLQTGYIQANQAQARGDQSQLWHPHRELSYCLTEFDEVMSPNVAAPEPQLTPVAQTPAHAPGIRPKGGPDHELEKIAESISRIEDLLYGTGKVSRNRPKKPAVVAPKVTKLPPRGDGPMSPKGVAVTAPESRPTTIYTANLANLNRPRRQFDDSGSDGLPQPAALIVSSSRALRAKYGPDGYRRIEALLDELVEVLQAQGVDGRLLLLDNAEALRKNGFQRLDPVEAARPDQVREILNAALPTQNANAPYHPDTIFIIGGPDIIPFWRLPNPTFDSDLEIMSDNPYGARDNTYLLPERIVGRLPDDGGPEGAGNLEFLLAGLSRVIKRQRGNLIPHSIQPGLPLRLLQAMVPSKLKSEAEEARIQRELNALPNVPAGGQFLDKARAGLLSPFFYSAEAWKPSTELLRDCMSEGAPVVFSPPLRSDSLDGGMFRRSRLLHFNLHGFRDNPNWYGQRHAGRIIASPSLSSLPIAFQPRQVALLQAPSPVVFTEACYGGYLAGKGVGDNIVLSLLAQGSAAVVGSSAISYGSAGPELSCAGRLSFYFWREVLQRGSSYGRALQAAKIEYARERLAAGHSLTGDDAKTLLEFSLLGDPLGGLRGANPLQSAFPVQTIDSYPTSGPFLSNETPLPKGGFTVPGFNIRLEWKPEDEEKLRGMVRRVWDKLGHNSQYQSVQYDKLPTDLRTKVDKVLAWLLPDPMPGKDAGLKAMIDLDSGYNPWQDGSNRPSPRYPKGGNGRLFEDWFNEDADHFADWQAQTFRQSETSHPEASLLLSGQRPIQTADGYRYTQTFHLKTDLAGNNIDVNLTRGKG